MKKCYNKRIEYVVPKLSCEFCRKQIKPGDVICTVVITCGDGRTTCRECYDQYKIDWTLHDERDKSKKKEWEP